MNSKRPRNNRNNPRRGPSPGGNRQSHTFDSNGPGMKIRGNPSQIFEKYQALARDAHTVGDRVMEENYAQHAEHYYRLANSEGTGGQQRHQQQPRPPRENTAELAENAEAKKEETAEPVSKDMANEPQPIIE